MTRPCQACDGTGCEASRDERGPHYYAHIGCRCDACEGSGRITDRIPASDAIADSAAWDCAIADLEDRAGLRFWRTAMIAYAAQSLQPHFDPKVFGTEAARAAFRAVPGLRGE